MTVLKSEIAAALGTSEETLDTMVGLVGSLQQVGLTDDAIAAWAATMALATVNAKAEGWTTAIGAAESATAAARAAALETIAAARARVDLARARVNSGADAGVEQTAVAAAAMAAAQAVGVLAQTMGAQAQALTEALAG